MKCFRRRLGERARDVLDWVDYRPDADFRFLFLIPPMLSVAWAYGGFVGLGLLLAVVLAIVLLVAAVFGVAILAWIVANALLDLAPRIRIPSVALRRVSVPSRGAHLRG